MVGLHFAFPVYRWIPSRQATLEQPKHQEKEHDLADGKLEAHGVPVGKPRHGALRRRSGTCPSQLVLLWRCQQPSAIGVLRLA